MVMKMIMRAPFLFLFFWLSGNSVHGQEAGTGQPLMVREDVAPSANSNAGTCSCEAEVRQCEESSASYHEKNCDEQLQAAVTEASENAHEAHQAEMKKLSTIIAQVRAAKDTVHAECDQRVSDSYLQAWREAEAKFNEQMTVGKEDCEMARSVYEKEVEKLNASIAEIKSSQESLHLECEKKVSESYTKAWRDAESNYGEQLKANRFAVEKANSAHETEIQKLNTIIGELQNQMDGLDLSCERRVAESYSTGFRQADAAGRKQIDAALSAAKLRMRLQNEYLTAEKQRLERQNREVSQRMSRTQYLLLETQRELEELKEKLEAKSMGRKAFDWIGESTSYTWKEIFVPTAITTWNNFGRERWERYGVPLWRHVEYVRFRLAVHLPLVVNLSTDIARTVLVEGSFFIQELPETLPLAIEDAWVASAPHRAQLIRYLEDTWTKVWGYLSSQTLNTRTKIASVFHHIVEEMHLEEMQPHIDAAKAQIAKLRQSLLPHLQRASIVWQSIKDKAVVLYSSSEGMVSESFARGKDVSGELMVDLRSVKHVVLEKVSASINMVFLFLRVYGSPKFILNLVAYCRDEPEAVIVTVGKLAVGILALFFVQRFLFPLKKRKRLSDRKVKFILTQ